MNEAFFKRFIEKGLELSVSIELKGSKLSCSAIIRKNSVKVDEMYNWTNYEMFESELIESLERF